VRWWVSSTGNARAVPCGTKADAPEVERQAIAALVQKCLDAQGGVCEAWEAEINERVRRCTDCASACYNRGGRET
jgi:hypothetical protein